MVCRQKVMKRVSSGLEGRGHQVKIISSLMMMTILMIMVMVTVMIMVMIAVVIIVIVVVVVIFIMRTAGWAPSLCGRGHRLRIR